jgi:protease-4
MESQFEQMVAGIAASRDMTPEAARALFDQGLLLGQQAVAAGAVDGMAYRDEVRAKLTERAGGASYLDWRDYLKRAGRPNRSGTGVALIYGAGMVLRGDSGYNPVLGELVMGSDTVGGAFRDAIADDDIEAILFRVDSPGGSAVASETIRREVIRARDAGKRVVISMGNVAASGGYWVSMDADRIIAQPGTITASIGVLSGKFLTTGFWEWTGITWDDVQTGPFSSFYSGSYDYTDQQWAAFQDWLDRIYDEFTRGVAAGRDLPLERVQEIAKGRVWTGADALERGLVDELGGYQVALRHIRELLELEDDAPLHLKLFPKEKTTFEKLAELMEGGSETRAAAAAMARTLQEIRPLIRGAGRIAVPPAARGVVHTPDLPAVE